MSELDIKLKIIENAENMAKEIHRGKKIEIDTCNGGIKVFAVEKKVVK